MTRQYIETPSEFKFAGDSGVVEGYASIFGNTDLGGDVVMPGAFQKFTRTRDGKTLMLYQHRVDAPIGKADVSQDSKGLAFRAQLVMSDATAKRAYNHMKEGLLDGMSIGYDVLPGGAQYKNDRRELSAVHLHEISAVTFGMNPAAFVETAKSARDASDIREFEGILRERLNISAREAKRIARSAWLGLCDRDGREDEGDRDDPAADKYLLDMAAALKTIDQYILAEGS